MAKERQSSHGESEAPRSGTEPVRTRGVVPETAESLYSEFLRLRQGDESVSFEKFRGQHRDHQTALEVLK